MGFIKELLNDMGTKKYTDSKNWTWKKNEKAYVGTNNLNSDARLMLF